MAEREVWPPLFPLPFSGESPDREDVPTQEPPEPLDDIPPAEPLDVPEVPQTEGLADGDRAQEDQRTDMQRIREAVEGIEEMQSQILTLLENLGDG